MLAELMAIVISHGRYTAATRPLHGRYTDFLGINLTQPQWERLLLEINIKVEFNRIRYYCVDLGVGGIERVGYGA